MTFSQTQENTAYDQYSYYDETLTESTKKSMNMCVLTLFRIAYMTKILVNISLSLKKR